MAPRKRSEIWNHFTDLQKSKAKSGYCNKILSITSGSFGNLSHHIKIVHPAIVLSKSKEYINNIDENLVDDPTEQGIFNCYT